jgi:hypothetical protein
VKKEKSKKEKRAEKPQEGQPPKQSTMFDNCFVIGNYRIIPLAIATWHVDAAAKTVTVYVGCAVIELKGTDGAKFLGAMGDNRLMEFNTEVLRGIERGAPSVVTPPITTPNDMRING